MAGMRSIEELLATFGDACESVGFADGRDDLTLEAEATAARDAARVAVLRAAVREQPKPKMCSLCKRADATHFAGVALDASREFGGIPIEIPACGGCFEEAKSTLARWFTVIEGDAIRRRSLAEIKVTGTVEV